MAVFDIGSDADADARARIRRALQAQPRLDPADEQLVVSALRHIPEATTKDSGDRT